jgi:hypothetical protein
MLRKLVIIGSIAALFVLTAAPAFGITLNKPGGGARVVLDIGDPSVGESNPAHGPICGVDGGPADCDKGVQFDNPGKPGAGPIPHPQHFLGVNTGAWNAVFGPGGAQNLNTPICGVGLVPIPADEAIYNCDI